MLSEQAIAHGAAIPEGRFERLPKWLNLVPMVLQWCWLGLRHGGIALPSTVNPGITAGGLVGEGKLEYFNAMGEVARGATATWLAVHNDPALRSDDLSARMLEAGLAFPIVAKPD